MTLKPKTDPVHVGVSILCGVMLIATLLSCLSPQGHSAPSPASSATLSALPSPQEMAALQGRRNAKVMARTRLRSRFTLEQRQRLYGEYIDADRKAIRDAVVARDSTRPGHVRTLGEIRDLYKEPLRKKWNITREELEALALEGLENNWQRPPYPE